MNIKNKIMTHLSGPFHQPEESHPHLPSGEWEGFYCYQHDPLQHKMVTELIFCLGKVTGSGTDDIAPFTWNGSYDTDAGKIAMTKHYATHKIFYRGDFDENGIWGIWEYDFDGHEFSAAFRKSIMEALSDQLKGGFHIWPKKSKEGRVSVLQESEILKDIFTKELGFV